MRDAVTSAPTASDTDTDCIYNDSMQNKLRSAEQDNCTR